MDQITGFLMDTWEFFANNITKPEILIGVIVLIGYILLKCPIMKEVGYDVGVER